MNIIFLDIDGVLNCELFYRERTKEERLIESPIRNICKDRVQWLNELCKDVGAKVVVSSTWRHSGLKYMQEILAEAGATFEVIDITPDLRFKGSVRGNEIKLWIDENIEKLCGVKYYDYNTYAIIDDDSDMLYWQRNNFFQTDTYSGLTPNTCYRIKRFFGSKKFQDG
jgi:histidinol phosphatase-like enzyme